MADATQTAYDKKNPFPAKLTENRLLNKPGSAKDTRHFVVDISGSGLSYTCGDSLGVFPANAESDVVAILKALGASGDEPVTLPKSEEPVSLREALSTKLSLAGPTPKTLAAFAEKATDAGEQARLAVLTDAEKREETKVYLEQRQFIDLLEEFPSVQFSAQEFVGLLKKLMPRLYSIASSPVVYPTEIHLTVATVRYHTNNRDRIGVCSTYMAERCPLDEPNLPVFVSNSHFGLPEDEARDMIMIGPGTGIAPFRAFVQERAAKGSAGRNWVFFGDQHEATDYLYSEEWEQYLADGKVQKLDLAWSRDQGVKVYVQDKMHENAKELWEWIDNGAMFYVCGDAKRMAKDVDARLHRIIEEQGGMSQEDAAAYVKQMRKEKRYMRDVY